MDSNTAGLAPCAIGPTRQSPIVIIEDATCLSELPNIEFDYKTLNVDLKNYEKHTVKITPAPTATDPVDPMGFIWVPVNERREQYFLREIHFHWGSEHKFKGTAAQDGWVDYSMEMHLVHRLPDAPDCSCPFSCAVVGVWIDTSSSYPDNARFAKVWDKLPNLDTVEYFFNANDLLPEANSRSYYHYNGSLTTGETPPPFQGNVLWYMLKTPVKLSEAQRKQYLAVFPKRYERDPQGDSNQYVLNQITRQ
jgi:carbonic anhydrase